MARFFFALTNPEVEALLKTEVQWFYPAFKFSYSRPGFLTFKTENASDFSPLMSRLSGDCVGKKTLEELVKLPKAWLWKRLAHFKVPLALQELSDKSLFRPGEKVSLIMMVGENEFWLGEYLLKSTHFQTPGEESSIPFQQVPSRAYFKLAEAYEAFDLPMDFGESVLELGSAPGGASLFLLEQELKVIGCDPADMAPEILKRSGFKHLRKPFEKINQENFQEEVDWIICDINLPPGVVMKEIDRLLDFLSPRGMVITLKLNQDRFLKLLPGFKLHLKKRGFNRVEFKYLPSHRQEICLVALT